MPSRNYGAGTFILLLSRSGYVKFFTIVLYTCADTGTIYSERYRTYCTVLALVIS
jgi:hypothetical protein